MECAARVSGCAVRRPRLASLSAPAAVWWTRWRGVRRPRLDVLGLPLHHVRAQGEVTAKPCAEALLSLRAADRMIERGVIAVQSQKDGDAVRLGRMQSIAEPLAA